VKVSKILSVLLVVLSLGFVGCGGEMYFFKFSITEPEIAKTISSPTGQDKNSVKMLYADSMANFEFRIIGGPLGGYPGDNMGTNYRGISIVISNNTDSIITIDWNRVTFIDPNGTSGNSVMHNNIKYTDCSSNKSPSIISPKGRLVDDIVPCYGVRFNSGGDFSLAGWEVKMIPDASEIKNVTFGLYLPIQFGTIIRNYIFSINGESVYVPPSY
jgi:hypothetical protein